MSIRTNIEEMIKRLDDEKQTGGTTIADDMRKKVVRAITGGASQWDDYMKLFAKDESELARLRPDSDDGEVSAKNLARAYLIGNGVCTVLSHQNLLFTVNDTLDFATGSSPYPIANEPNSSNTAVKKESSSTS